MVGSRSQTPAARRAPGKRAGLDLDQIVEAARTLDVNDISMQAVANILHVDRKALNYHVKDRESLLQLVAMHTFACGFDDTGIAQAEDWKSAARIYATKFVRGVASVGDLAEHLWFGESLMGWALSSTEALLQQFDRAGFSGATMTRLMTIFVTICLGHARDVALAAKADERPRHRSLRNVLEDAPPSSVENLIKLYNLDLDTYSDEQLRFAVEFFIQGASRILENEAPA
jgi:hypothetical protein